MGDRTGLGSVGFSWTVAVTGRPIATRHDHSKAHDVEDPGRQVGITKGGAGNPASPYHSPPRITRREPWSGRGSSTGDSW